MDAAGNLYGVTPSGDTAGGVFELSPPSVAGGAWSETTLYRFFNGPDGGFPLGSLILYGSGNLIGTTEAGGVFYGPPYGHLGAVYQLSPPSQPGGSWAFTTLYSFPNPNAGAHPYAGVV